MELVTRNEFLSAIKAGDIGITYSKSLFSKLQNLFRKRFKEGPAKASHGFYVKDPPKISEANGFHIKEASYLKNLGNTTYCYFFRYKPLGLAELDDMNDFVRGAEETSGHYSIAGILQFAKSFITRKLNMPDESGVFCTEYTSKIINTAKLQYITERKAWEIDPSYQLNWFLTEGQKKGWVLAAFYDGKDYLIEEDL